MSKERIARRVAQELKDGDRVVSETAAVIDPNNPMSRRGLPRDGATA